MASGQTKTRSWHGRGLRPLHPLLLVAVLALTSLGIWWVILQWQQMQTVYTLSMERQQLQMLMVAHGLGLRDKHNPPVIEPDSIFEIVSDSQAHDIAALPLQPNFPELLLQVKPQVLKEQKVKHRSRMVMVAGEGSLLIILIVILCLGLYFLWLSERRARRNVELFFQAVSHELKTPVAGVKALLETFSSGGIPEEKQARYARLGLIETNHLQSLIENVLLANRIQQGIFNSQPRPLQLIEGTREFVERRNRLFSDKRAEVVVDCADEISVWADPDLMRHIMENLLDNAFKYSSDVPEVRVILQETDEWGMIVVEDNGVGLSRAERKAMFHKLWRGPSERIGEIKGSGLGLYIARQLLRSFGGELIAQSNGPGKGTRMILHLKKVA